MKPGRSLLYALLLWTAAGLLVVWWPAAAAFWQGMGLLLGAIALTDLLLLQTTHTPEVHRKVASILPQGVWSPVELSLTNGHARALRLDCHDLHPSDFEVRDLPQTLTIGPRERLRLRYRLRSPRRGLYRFSGCDLRLHAPLMLWSRRRAVRVIASVRVYPNFAEISRYALLAGNDQLARMGVRRLQRRGSGAEFHQLREYRRGDTARQIDWKATSCTRKLIAREYQDERDQRLLFLLDCGRRMRHVDTEGRGHLDEALNALLLLVYVAVRQGDAVGLMTYGGPRRWFAPRQDPDTVNRLLAAVYNLEAGLDAADPLTAARELLQRQPRRALVVFVTNSRDEDHPELLRAVQVLRRRHLVLVADLRESILDETLAAPIHSHRQALRFHGTHAYLTDRHRQHERLHHLGARVLDLLPRQLPPALVNAYVAAKRAGTL
ncbi:MAG: DUF58 domain-containing protein [Thiohalocapsa sp.]